MSYACLFAYEMVVGDAMHGIGGGSYVVVVVVAQQLFSSRPLTSAIEV